MLDQIKHIYEKHYKKLMLIPLLILVLSIGVLFYWNYSTGEFVSKDVSLKGGTLITVNSGKSISIDVASAQLEDMLGVSVRVTKLSSVGIGGVIGYSFEFGGSVDKDVALSEIGKILETELAQDDYTLEEISASLGASFWSSTIKAILIAFAFMALVVFIYFRKPAPCLAIILAAATDLIAVLAIINLTGIRLSSAGVAALLMLIGYSVDSDVLLSTMVLKRHEGSLMSRIYSAMKTGLTMEVTTLAALAVLYFVAPASTLKTIALVLIIGILIDLPSTWLMNAGLLRWYTERKNKK